MEKKAVLAALTALSQETRLDIFRLLVQTGPEGRAAGAIAETLGVTPATLSFHLNQLAHAGLIVQRREGRSLIYSADFTRMDGLIGFLVENCCGRPSNAALLGRVCGPIPATANEVVRMTDVTIYHNPECGTSRNTLGLIRNSGVEPTVIEYLKTPPGRETLADLVRRMGAPLRDMLRRKGTPYDELGLDDPSLTDDQLLDAMMAHPILINRPIVVTPLGVRLCRPSEAVLDILPDPQRGPFTKEDGEPVVDGAGNRIL